MDDVKFDGKITVIIPRKNGFILMPYNSDLLTSFKRAWGEKHGVIVATDVDGLIKSVAEIYAPDEQA